MFNEASRDAEPNTTEILKQTIITKLKVVGTYISVQPSSSSRHEVMQHCHLLLSESLWECVHCRVRSLYHSELFIGDIWHQCDYPDTCCF